MGQVYRVVLELRGSIEYQVVADSEEEAEAYAYELYEDETDGTIVDSLENAVVDSITVIVPDEVVKKLKEELKFAEKSLAICRDRLHNAEEAVKAVKSKEVLSKDNGITNEMEKWMQEIEKAIGELMRWRRNTFMYEDQVDRIKQRIAQAF